MKKELTRQELANLTGINKRTLRFWDDKGLFLPARQDKNNRYNYYSPKQIITIKFISILSKLGIPLKTISSVINNKNPKAIMEIMEKQKCILEIKIKQLQEMHSVITTRSELIKYGLASNQEKISIKNLPEIPVTLGVPNEFKETDDFYNSFINFCKTAENLNINLAFPIGGYHETVDSFFKLPDKPEKFFSLKIDGSIKNEHKRYLVGYSKGYYGDLNSIAKEMKKYANKNNLSLSGPVYTVYLHDEVCVQNPDEYLVQVCIAIEK